MNLFLQKYNIQVPSTVTTLAKETLAIQSLKKINRGLSKEYSNAVSDTFTNHNATFSATVCFQCRTKGSENRKR